MRFMLLFAIGALLVAGCHDASQPLDPSGTQPLAAAGGPRVVHVAPPTGDVEQDRARILAALEQVRPGGTVQFAPGTYVIGVTVPDGWDYIRVSVPRVTLLGHPTGTILRGCDPEEIVISNCVGLLLTGGHQTIRNLSFEEMSAAIVLGRRPPEPTETIGGYRVEGNTFRNSRLGIRAAGQWQQPAIIRNNIFVNLFASVLIYGKTVHALDNDISAPEPERIPFFELPGVALFASDFTVGPCENNVFARNRVEGHENGVLISVFEPGPGCRHNMVRDNTIINSIEFEPYAPAWGIGLGDYSEHGGLVADNLVQGNRILGSEGQGIAIYAGERNRIVNNTITNVTMTDPFPPEYGEGNGTGIWIGPGSRENQILANTFAAVESYEVVLEGDYNHVATRSRSDVVLDLGIGNRVTGPGSVVTTGAPAARVLPPVAERAEAAQQLRRRLRAGAW